MKTEYTQMKCTCGKIIVISNNSDYHLKQHLDSNYHKRWCKLGEFNKCELCKAKDKIIYIHHKDKNHKNSESKNLMYVCSKCHINIHKIIGFRKENPKNDKKQP